MHLYYENVNDAFHGICEGFHTGQFGTDLPTEYGSSDRFGLTYASYQPPISRTPSRYGEVLVIEEPVTITYDKPLQRVLFNAYRDANPFFHLIEALWTLAGRDDIAPLEHFVPRVREFSDDGKTWWGAYGKRWKECKQLEQAIAILRKDRICRRVVLQQWMPYDLTRQIDGSSSKDLPCNTEVMFLPRREHFVEVALDPKWSGKKEDPIGVATKDSTTIEKLDMTVINRSNDMLWGALGSNYVTFSFLHEYVALAAGYEVGRYNQFTNNLHVYVNRVADAPADESPWQWSGKWHPEKLIAEPVSEYPQTWGRLYDDKEAFDYDLQELFAKPEAFGVGSYWQHTWSSPFFREVVRPMCLAWNFHKQRKYPEARGMMLTMPICDWRDACSAWLFRREKKLVSA